ncbi:MAG: DUF58 domain-containing protein [Solirubrobacteraceae bacterium]
MAVGRAAGVAIAGCVFGLLALVFDAAPLFVVAVGLAATGLAAPAWVWLTIRGARAERHLTTDRVIEDEPLEAIIAVRRGWLGRGGGGRFEVADPFTGSRFDFAQRMTPSTQRSTAVRVVTRFTHRGPHRLPPPSLTVSDPLELATARSDGAGAVQQLLVLPRTEPVRWARSGPGRRLQLPDGRVISEALAAVDLDGLRPYRPGTPASRIHWPAVARGAGLIERRLAADGDARPLVVLDARLPASSGEAGSDLLDAAVRAAASLVLDLARGGGCGLLLPGEQRPTAIDRELGAWPAAYARLALVQGGPETRAPALSSTTVRSGALIYVAASPVDRLGAILTAPGRGPTVLVVPSDSLVAGRPRGTRGALLAALAVSGCRGFLIGAGRTRDATPAQRSVA